jgi:uncharacterized FlaG/YvyC family protein
MIDKILNYFHYYKVNNEDILQRYVSNLPNMDGEMTIEDEADLMKRLSNVDGFKTWINFVIFRDTKNYYVAINDKQRDTIRGASQRMIDVLKRMNDATKPKTETTRISGVRYGH